MARLYMKAYSDTGGMKTKTGNRYIKVKVFYGSASRSIQAGEIIVEFPKGAKKPKVSIRKSVR